MAGERRDRLQCPAGDVDAVAAHSHQAKVGLDLIPRHVVVVGACGLQVPAIDGVFSSFNDALIGVGVGDGDDSDPASPPRHVHRLAGAGGLLDSVSEMIARVAHPELSCVGIVQVEAGPWWDPQPEHRCGDPAGTGRARRARGVPGRPRRPGLAAGQGPRPPPRRPSPPRRGRHRAPPARRLITPSRAVVRPPRHAVSTLARPRSRRPRGGDREDHRGQRQGWGPHKDGT